MSRALLRSVLELRTRTAAARLLPLTRLGALSTAPTAPTATAIPPVAHVSAPAVPAVPTPGAAPPLSPGEKQGRRRKQHEHEQEDRQQQQQQQHPSVHQLMPLLAAQPRHYITVHIHGRPYLVTPGDQIRLPFLMPGVLAGDVLRLNRASVLGSRDYTLKGAPHIDESLFECRATVIGVETEPLRFKKKKKQRTRKTKMVKSKHKYTVLRISELKICQPRGGEDGDELLPEVEVESWEPSVPKVAIV